MSDEKLNAQLRALEMMGGNVSSILEKAGVAAETQQVVNQEVETPKGEPVKNEPVKIETPLFVANYGEEVQEDEENLADINVLSNYAKKYGFEIKSPKDLKTVFEAYNKAQKEKDELLPKAEEAESIKSILNNLPKEIANPFTVWLNNGDYKAELKKIASNPLDLSKDFNSYGEKEVKNIIDYYYPNKYDAETWEDLDDNLKESVREAASLKYNIDRNSFINLQSEQEKQILTKKQAIKQSIDNSISSLKKANPFIKEAEVKEIEKQMHGGFNERLYNSDGTFKENAAEQIAYAIFGKQTLETLQQTLEQKMQASINKAVGKVNEDIVMRYSDKTPENPGGDDPNVVSQIVKNQTSFLKKKSLFTD